MLCYDPFEQCFNLKDKVIGIDWGKNGDKAVQVAMRKENDGKFTVVEVKEIYKL